MTMTDDLVERWRVAAKSDRAAIFYVPAGHMRAIFNRIEALTAERDEALNQLDSERHSIEVLEKRVAGFMADNALLREVVLEADKLLCGDLTGLQWKRECRSFLVLARAVLKGETRD